MDRRDPIQTSSPPPQFRGFLDSDDEDEEEINTVPTQPLWKGTQPTQMLQRNSLAAVPAEPHITQPTQPLATQPRTQRRNSPSQVQVPRSSPATDRANDGPFPKARTSAMAPPGTMPRFPPPVARQPAHAIDLTSDDPPVAQDSDEEPYTGSNIAPSKLEQRVQETPQKGGSFGFDLAAKFGHESRKRAADDVAAPPAKRAQTGPSRAKPIDLTGEDMRVDEISDLNLRSKVERLGAIYPAYSVKDRLDAVVLKRGNFSDASLYLMEQAENDPLQQSPAKGTAVVRGSPLPVLKTTAKRTLANPVKSLQDRYAKPSQAAVIEGSEPPQKKRKLMRGRKNRSPSPVLLSSSPPLLQQQQKKPKQRPVVPDDAGEDLNEGITLSSDDESDAQEAEEVYRDDGELLDFFNNCTLEGMVDLSGHKAEDVSLILEHRPFKSLEGVEKIHVDSRKVDSGKKARKPKTTFGERLVEAARAMWNAYTTIDEVVKKCEARGRPMINGMARWGIDIFGGKKDGEIAVTSLRDDSDSGYHSPITNGSESEREGLRKAMDRKKKLLKKPANMNADVELKDYQVVGLNWLNMLWQNKISGILADDMGLGKTCQVIAFLSHLKETGQPGPHLIVVPGSTLENWAREFKHFSEDMNFKIYYGSQGERFEMQPEMLEQIQAGEIDVVLTTYDLCGRKEDNTFLRKCKPQMAIFDEGHMLRSSNTKRYQDLMKIKATCRLLLTGTPLQNSLQELASILAFLMPDIFEEPEVHNSVQIVFKHKAKVNESDTHESLLSTQRINRARSMMTPFVLRRKKAQVLKHLPKKTSRVEYCELTPIQKTLYSEQLERQRKILLDRAAGLLPKESANVMMRLRQAAIHPLLFRTHYNDDLLREMSNVLPREPIFAESVPEYIYQDLELYRDFEAHKLCLQYPSTVGKHALTTPAWMDSGKVAALVALLKQYKANGDRALVFSQFTSVMDILEWVLDDLSISYCRIDGSTPITQRQQLLDVFSADTSIPVFMLSTRSGGAGINLAAANKVVIFDSSFNPQDDVQAENRAHRVGQTREVEVVRLVSKGTVEEQIYALGQSKLELDKMVAGEEGDGAAGKTAKKAGGAKEEALDDAQRKGIAAVEAMLLKEMEMQQQQQKEKEEPDKEEDKAKKDVKGKPKKDVKEKPKKDVVEKAKKDVKDVKQKPQKDVKDVKQKPQKDVKEEFLDGLKRKGLDMSAA